MNLDDKRIKIIMNFPLKKKIKKPAMKEDLLSAYLYLELSCESGDIALIVCVS